MRFYPTSKAAAAELWRTYDEDTHKWTLYFVNDALHPQVWLSSLEDGIWQFYRRWELNGKQMISRQSWSASPGGLPDDWRDDVKLVAKSEGRATAPAWSKDGKQIFFANCWNVDFGRDCEIFAALLHVGIFNFVTPLMDSVL